MKCPLANDTIVIYLAEFVSANILVFFKPDLLLILQKNAFFNQKNVKSSLKVNP